MPEPHPRQTPADRFAGMEWVVLDLLLDEDERPKSVAEIVREIGSAVAVADALDALHRFGIIHHVGDFVFVTRSSARFNQIRR